MKIEQELRPILNKKQLDYTNKQIGLEKFSDLVEKNDQKLQNQELDKLMKDIDVQGEKLAHSRTFQELGKYKKLVKRFVQEAIDYGLRLKQSHSFDSNGKNRKLQIVKRIDEHLLELTSDVMNEEKQSIDILGKIGEIKGLIINLYM